MNRCNTLIVDPSPEADRAGVEPLRITLSPGDAGTDETIAAMVQLIRDARLVVPDEWRTIVFNAGSLYRWLVEWFGFQADPPGQERLKNPRAVWRQLHNGPVVGDCDDLAMIGCSIARSIGWPCCLIVVGRKPAPAPFEHVFFGIGSPRAVVDEMPRGVVPLDPQERTPIGQLPAGVKRVRVYPVN